MSQKKSSLEELELKFLECCFTLSEEDILEFDKEDNGPITNVIAGIDTNCYGVKLYDDRIGLMADMFYINGENGLRGDIISLNLRDPDYFGLLMHFCTVLCRLYPGLNELDIFNTFQKKLRGFLEKSGFFTATNLELKQFEGQNAVMVGLARRGIFKIDFIDKKEFYRNYFNDNFADKHVPGQDYVYLMVNCDTSLIKIGTSKNPAYRERTLHSQEPAIHLIAKWCCSKEIERKLHAMYRQKSARGEWFRLSLGDLAEIEVFMKKELDKWA
ncbi:GIY-YIG nuclease family protein [Pedobacter psychroterrae]|uniref:Meiotically Up-regulated Gene 113 (MUG113) protein n=1 Tax=Pedobacter psychroterrae TaxID=2530453 RepID=A0A4R0NQ98_9SPHI|nr:GIY-YIG nuclease family protein [Pedobacter psychroterrae]TCD03220.1 hypothetical protein EZ437_04400 [Pedobacter psychroterrae]